MGVLTIVGLVLAAVAAAVHVLIFVLESLAWTSPRARGVFGTTVQEAEATRELAFNQGYYNLFLAVLAAGGVVVHLAGEVAVGTTLVGAGCGSMVAAALVLLVSSPDKRGAALKQGTAPLLALVALALG